jgi:tRNA(Ile)-lysidine synthase
VSGGPDSVAALVILRELRSEFGYELLAAHFDHQLREDSRADLEWVRATCKRLEVTCLSGEGDVAAAGAEQRVGVEEMARRMRYQFLAFVAAEKRAERIATGHTADDQAETVLQRMIRGSGVRGIRGMLPLAPVPGAPAQVLVRPLLILSRTETEQVCRDAGIEPRVDPSNRDRRYTRNRVRHEVLPVLAAINPSIRDALVRLADSAQELFVDVERKAMSTQPAVRGPLGSLFTAGALKALPLEGLALVIEREAAFHGLTFAVNRTQLENARQSLAKGTGGVRFGDVVLQVSSGHARMGTVVTAPPQFDAQVLNVPGITLAGPWRIQISTSPLGSSAGDLCAALDGSATHGVLRVRRLVPGDRTSYHGRRRKVSDILADHKVPAWERGSTRRFAPGV